MVVDRGHDFPIEIQENLDAFGEDMWLYRDRPEHTTTRALNAYKGDHRGFEYLTPRIRITPHDLMNTKLEQPAVLHFICSPVRAATIISEVQGYPGWKPITVYEPIPDRCVPEELPALIKVLPSITILSPNAEEALSLLSMSLPPTKALIEEACRRLLDLGVGNNGSGCVIIRSGALGAYVATREREEWIDAFWVDDDSHIVDVTGAGNSFLGGLGAGLLLAHGDIYEATLYATVSASFTIEQEGLPRLSRDLGVDGEVTERWNGDLPRVRFEELQRRLAKLQRNKSCGNYNKHVKG
ncbi:Uncharacterized protein C16C9.01c [Grifola frondosa]|uniref:Uncharacterized protein C16C9.01c n=1 Tax=Grifola frondosa TaxID=5627 RepID=A0A1C7MK41_GRIFR|nr:Uncharacterized protein C16C9.01c [Grifola frondosa]